MEDPLRRGIRTVGFPGFGSAGKVEQSVSSGSSVLSTQAKLVHPVLGENVKKEVDEGKGSRLLVEDKESSREGGPRIKDRGDDLGCLGLGLWLSLDVSLRSMEGREADMHLRILMRMGEWIHSSSGRRMGYLGSCGPNSRKMMGKWMNSPGLNSSDFGLGTDLRKFLTAELMMVWSWENGEIVELKG